MARFQDILQSKKTSVQQNLFCSQVTSPLSSCYILNCWFSFGNRDEMEYHRWLCYTVWVRWCLLASEFMWGGYVYIPQRTFIAILCVLPATAVAFEFGGQLAPPSRWCLLSPHFSCTHISTLLFLWAAARFVVYVYVLGRIEWVIILRMETQDFFFPIWIGLSASWQCDRVSSHRERSHVGHFVFARCCFSFLIEQIFPRTFLTLCLELGCNLNNWI